MRNLKKLFAVIVAICIIFTFAIPAFAATTAKYATEAATLNTLHLYDGISSTTFVPDLGTAVDRQTSIALLVKVLGKKDAALAMATADVDATLATFTDAKDIAVWARPYMAYAIKNSLTNGTSATTLSPKAAVTGNMYATFILRNLGYTVDNFNYGLATLQAKGGLTPVQASDFNKNLIKDDIVGISYNALQAVDTIGKKLVENLIDAKVFTQDVAVKAGVYTVASFAVKSVESTNLKEVVIAFTQDANMESDSTATNWDTSALNPANYGGIGTLAKIDSKTVRLTLTTTAVSGAPVSIAVKNVKDSAIANAIPDYAKAFLAADTAAPTATASVDVNRLLTITFSEPMKVAGTEKVYVGGALTTVVFSADLKSATATLGATYEAGKSYPVVIVGAQDLAGKYLNPNPTTLNITMVNDTVKPAVASVTSAANATKLNVKFSEILSNLGTVADPNYATLTIKNPAGTTLRTVAANAIVADTDSLVYSADVSGLLGAYSYMYIDVTVSTYKDIATNAGDSLTTRVLLQKDTTAPAFVSAKAATDNKSITVNFDEVVALGSAAVGGISVEYTNNDGIVYTAQTLDIVAGSIITGTNGANTAIKVAPTKWLNDDGTLKAGIYTITIAAKAIEDAYTNETAAAIAAPVTVGTVTSSDTTAPTLSDAAFIAGSNTTLVVTSNEDLATPVLSNITIDGAALPAGSKAYLFNDKKTVRIEVPSDSIALTGYRVLSYKLADLAGNVTTKSVALNFIENTRPVVSAAVLSDPQTIVLTTAETVKANGTISDDFEVYVNGVKATVTSVSVPVAGSTSVTIALSSAVALSDTLTVKVVGSDLVDLNGNALVSGGTFTVTR